MHLLKTDKMKKVYVICHMMASLDGRIDCDMTSQIGSDGYYEALEALNLDATIEGKTTALMHYALKELFHVDQPQAVRCEEIYKSHDADRWEAVVDTKGTLLWPETDTKDRLCIVSEKVSRQYLDYLKTRSISYIVTGEQEVDLLRAIEILKKDFGSERIGVVGGGHINGSFLAKGLLDEVSMVYGAAIDGREGFCAAFDGIDKSHSHPFMLHLKSVRQMGDDSVWLRYNL